MLTAADVTICDKGCWRLLRCPANKAP